MCSISGHSSDCRRLAALISIAVVTFCDVTAVPCAFVMTSTDGAQAQCSNRRLTRFPSEDWPPHITSLDISSNFLTSLASLADVTFADLRHLDVSRNSLTSLEEDSFAHAPGLQTLNLGHNMLIALPHGVFRGLRNLTSLNLENTALGELRPTSLSHAIHLAYLNLGRNQFEAVPTETLRPVGARLETLDMSGNLLLTVANHSFQGLRNLLHLSLASNRLYSLQADAFSSMRKLRTLDLTDNKLQLDNAAYPPGVFDPVGPSLQVLHLRNNDAREEGEYPLNVFTPLRSLRRLSVDTFGKPRFGEAFASLTSLTSLILHSEGCNMKRLSNDTLDAFRPNLETLVIDDCPLIRVEPCAFCRLPALTSLTVKSSRFVLDLSYPLLALRGLQIKTMDLVDFSKNRRHSRPIMLDEINFQLLSNTCIRRLNLKDNDIVAIVSSNLRFDSPFLKCIQHLDLSLNRLNAISKALVLKLMIGAIHLETAELQDQQAFIVYGLDDRPYSDPDEQSDITLYVNTASSMRVLNLTGAVQNLSQMPKRVDFPRGGNLTSLGLAYVGAYDCDVSITGLTAITDLDFSGNDCRVMGVELFRHMGTLRRLKVVDSSVSQTFLSVNGSELLRPLTELEELNLGHNSLHLLPDNLLQHQTRLQRLGFAGNRFQTIPVDLNRQSTLIELDVSGNMIPSLSLQNRRDLDRLAQLHGTFTLRLRGNPLSCTCQALDAVRWLATTSVRLDGDSKHLEDYDSEYDDNGRDFPCVLEDGTVSSTGSVMAQWDVHWRRCVGFSWLAGSAVALLAQLLALTLTFVAWSNWSYVRHAWRVLRHLRLPHRRDFRYDAVLVHSDDNTEMAYQAKANVQRCSPGLRLATLHELIHPGSFVADGIATCVEQSWKVVLLVTQDFLEDDWSGYAVHQAQGSISDVTPDRVFVLLTEGPPRPLDGPDPLRVSLSRLLRTIPETCVFNVPAEVPQDHRVWRALAQDIARDRA